MITKFQATRRWSDDLANDCETWIGEPGTTSRGWMYCGDCLFIEEVTPDWPAETRALGRWYLLIGRNEYITDDLAKLEQILHDYAAAEGLLTE